MYPGKNSPLTPRPYTVAIVSGKGGVGKTNVAANLAVMLSGMHRRTLLHDADLGLANVDVLFGLTPQTSVEDIIVKQGNLNDALISGPSGVTILPACSGVSAMAELPPDSAQWLSTALVKVMADFEIVIIDAPSGIASNMQRMADLADEVIILTTPEPTAVMDAYAVAKIFTARNPDMPLKLMVNMISDLDAGERISAGFHQVASRFLDRNIETVAKMPFDPMVQLAVRRQVPFALSFPYCPATEVLRDLGHQISRSASARQREGNFSAASVLRPTMAATTTRRRNLPWPDTLGN